MPVGGKLQLKGGTPWGVKKKKRKRKDAEDAGEQLPGLVGTDGKPISVSAVSVQTGKTYEQEFSLEIEKAKEGKVKNTPWGSSFRAPPQILHGYDKPVTGKSAQERLDIRCAVKTDKFCK
ncbi:hypothetical protein WJX81_000428 [Elliptochloris bilobata]|uniref:Uncharacterized protein n=1 Tax=Elliptochloris bilobata TaxID=381761 RepID=A0AAW1RAJ2_9CHLO